MKKKSTRNLHKTSKTQPHSTEHFDSAQKKPNLEDDHVMQDEIIEGNRKSWPSATSLKMTNTSNLTAAPMPKTDVTTMR